MSASATDETPFPDPRVADASNPGTETLHVLFPGNSELDIKSRGLNSYEFVVYNCFAPATQLWGPGTCTNLKDDEPYRINLLMQDFGRPDSGGYILLDSRDDIFSSASGSNVAAGALGIKVTSEGDVTAHCLFVEMGERGRDWWLEMIGGKLVVGKWAK